MSSPVLDFYDDGGKLLCGLMSPDQLPDEMKYAEMLSADDLATLPNDLFALVLVRDGEPPLRKFACTDKVQTALSSLYFARTYKDLPPEAVKIAAANLVRAHQVYGLPRSEMLEDLAETGGLPKTACSEKITQKKRVQIEDHLEDAPYGEAKKEGDLTGTEVMPRTVPPGGKGKKPSIKKLSEANVASADGPTLREFFPEPRKVHHWAFLKNGVKRYPLDTLDQIRSLERTFATKLSSIPPDDRATIARALRRREIELGLPVPEVVEKYAGSHYQPIEVMRAWMDLRKDLSSSSGLPTRAYDDLLAKRAEMHPLEFARALAGLDRSCGLDWYWGERLADPWESTLAIEKQATIIYNHGGVLVTDKNLEDLVKSKEVLSKILEEDILEEFSRDPVGVFKSLPDPLKRTIGRLAMDDPGKVRPGLVR